MLCLLTACNSNDPEVVTLGVLPDTGITGEAISYSQDIKPILETRCVACHACYDAPCQLKLTAHEGVTRGGSKERVYNHKSLREGKLSRLFFDAQSETEWRDQGFHSVLADANSTTSNPVPSSTLTGLLDLKSEYQKRNPEARYDELPIDDQTTWQCAADRGEFLNYADDYPERGMPYGLPALSKSAQTQITHWVTRGAMDDTDYSLTKAEQKHVDRWESWLNSDDKKQQLISRYIYEHLFLANLYFSQEAAADRRYFELVRSSTPPGQPLAVIATRRPFDDPGIERVYYRLRLDRETPVAKTHMPYPLNEEKMANWVRWFVDPDYDVDHLPSYAIKAASNPFKTFAQLPPDARYRFMLDEANFIVRGFIKGPVCKGQAAVNVINEHFWVFFVDPKYQSGPEMKAYLATVQDELDLPAEKEDTLRLFDSWNEFAKLEKKFLTQRHDFIGTKLATNDTLPMDRIWDGDGTNPNAALTIFRHFDHASVQQGLNGQPPKTAWVIDYPLLERIHYLLVAGYDVYGNVSHQLLSRIYMDFLRMEGESLFLTTLPEETRSSLLAYWYRGADQRIHKFMSLTFTDIERKTEKQRYGKDHKPSPQQVEEKLAVYSALEQHIGGALSTTYDLEHQKDNYSTMLFEQIQAVQSIANEGFKRLPEVSLLAVNNSEGVNYFTLIKNRGLLNNTSILLENLNQVPEETTVSIIPGFIASRPNTFLRVNEVNFPEFIRDLQTMDDKESYHVFLRNYAVSRRDPQFWTHYDAFQTGFKQFSPVDYGVLDLNKLITH
ncbi:9-hexadecenoic acid cis-trans isomerase [Arenicella chitinivorans]|uniref:9-hexadecenoic acid cis-trans isomerase n=2 Tax=Arenicella chitinivorans TaxID=1329800 RepID=A0A918RUG7_9GAMM|nr:9-hexadecenoic acid cis-trans isomerase [Arenicella chitinivorans]